MFKVHFILALERVCEKLEIYLDVFGNSNKPFFFYFYVVVYLNILTNLQ